MSHEPAPADDDSAAAAARAARSRRREAAKRHHPDLGGDPEEFIRAMQAAGPRPSERRPPDVVRPAVTVVHTTAASRAARTVSTTTRTLVREVRQRLPRSFPGSRRYGRL